MRYHNSELREWLAAEYVLGTLHGLARKRFTYLMKYDAELRRIVAKWEEYLFSYNYALDEATPSASLWRAILGRINSKPDRRRLSTRLSKLTFWAGFASLASIVSLALGIYLITLPQPEPPMSMLAVLQDRMANPTIMVSWSKTVTTNAKIKVQVIMPNAKIAENRSWELWAVPADKSAPVSLGVITTDAEQTLQLPERAARTLHNAMAIAISVEPTSGSPRGYPTGSVLYQGAVAPIS